jgi:hypothetical protein
MVTETDIQAVADPLRVEGRAGTVRPTLRSGRGAGAGHRSTMARDTKQGLRAVNNASAGARRRGQRTDHKPAR